MTSILEEKLSNLRTQQRNMVAKLCRMIDGARESQKPRRYRHVARKISGLIEQEARIERAIASEQNAARAARAAE